MSPLGGTKNRKSTWEKHIVCPFLPFLERITYWGNCIYIWHNTRDKVILEKKKAWI